MHSLPMVLPSKMYAFRITQPGPITQLRPMTEAEISVLSPTCEEEPMRVLLPILQFLGGIN